MSHVSSVSWDDDVWEVLRARKEQMPDKPSYSQQANAAVRGMYPSQTSVALKAAAQREILLARNQAIEEEKRRNAQIIDALAEEEMIEAEKAKAAEAEQAASLDATIRQIFNEIDAVGLAAWRRDVIGYNGNDMQFGHIVRVRCGLVASRAGLSESETAAAVLRLYPDLEGYL